MIDPQAAAEELLADEIDASLADEGVAPSGEQTGEETLLDELVDDIADEEGEPAEEGAEEAAAEVEIPPAPDAWSKEDAAAWKTLTPEAREIVARREAEVTKGFREMGRKVSEATKAAERDAVAAVAQHAENFAAQLQIYAEQFTPQPPNPQLLYTGNPDDVLIYQRQDAAYREALSQQQALHQKAQQSQQQAQRARQTLTTSELEAETEKLREVFPEYLDPNTGPELQRKLASTAQRLGYSPELFAQAGADDIVALKQATADHEDALKYRKLMADKMEGVRAAKNLPKMARPGVTRTTGQVNAAAKENAWSKVKETKDPGAFADFLGLS